MTNARGGWVGVVAVAATLAGPGGCGGGSNGAGPQGGGGTAGGANGGNGGGGAGAPGGRGGGGTCAATGFAATPMSWPLPAGAGYSYQQGVSDFGGCPSYATIDLDGDGKPDLVITDDCGTTPTVGVDHWLVYLNGGSGFAATPTSWPLPTRFNYTYRPGVTYIGGCPSYTTADFDGDGKPDLVLTDDCDPATTVGVTYWVVYFNSGSGFSANPTNWPLPAAAADPYYYDGLSNNSVCPSYATTDLDGDGKPDLVVTNDCGTTTTVGTDHWLVYLNSGSGFSVTPTSWPLPLRGQGTYQLGVSNNASCASYGTIDMNGDGRPDLVVTSDCDAASTVGVDHWLVYLNTGSGFAATATSWPLPSRANAAYNQGLYASPGCPSYAAIDVSGDGRPDLVVTGDCGATATLGADHWLAYLNTGSGFASTPTSWPLPARGNFAYDEGLSFNEGCPVYATIDMSGDGKPDLVIAYECDATSTVGSDHWLVYPAVCP